jgi:hypothetical protein
MEYKSLLGVRKDAHFDFSEFCDAAGRAAQVQTTEA